MGTEKPRKILSLRSFITGTVSLIVTAVLLGSVLFYYKKTSDVLTDNYEQSVTRQLSQVNQKITDQIDSIDSIIPLYLSNTLISESLESSSPDKNSVERQMSFLYNSSSLSDKNFTDSIYIIRDDRSIFSTYTSGALEPVSARSKEILQHVDTSETQLMCLSLPSDSGSMYFIRNLFSSNSGRHIGTFVIDVDIRKWITYCAKGVDPAWFICLFNSDMNIISDTDMQQQGEALQELMTSQDNTSVNFQMLDLCGREYFAAAQNLEEIGFTSAAAAPKDLLFEDLNNTLSSYLLLLACTIFIALFAAIVVSRAITRPIDKMIEHINQISRGEQASLPPLKMYHEFDVWADSFNRMLKQLDIYYNDNFQKQLLLKNSEIRALQSQMDPHFLFNILNTIAWKAQMTDNEEIYQMVISLGELLKMNTLSKERDYIELSKEMEYVKFYIYLQQMRFEDKITCHIQIPEELMQCLIPCFCIQPLVENAIVHGLEPKKGKGKLVIQILKTDENAMEISIIDDGVGFQHVPDIRSIASSDEDSHTHIGLRNLDKRLELLFGEEARLKIDSVPGRYTSISFKIPIREGETA